MTDQIPVVALCADKKMEVGLHVTLYSLLKNYSRKDQAVKIHAFLKDFSSHDISLLRTTLDRAGADYQLHLQPVELDAFKNFPSLHGDYMTYARLILADILRDEEKLLYLDSDLLVGVDVHDLFHADLQNRTLGAVVGRGTVEWSLDGAFFLKMGFERGAPYFNAGVLLMDAATWRAKNLTQECLAVCEKYSDQLVCHDQTVLNFMFNKKTLDLNACYNVQSRAIDKATSEDKAKSQITHFVGSPKPWDMFGNLLHSNYPLYRKYFKETALHGRIQLQPKNLYRMLRLGRSYFKVISAKCKS